MSKMQVTSVKKGRAEEKRHTAKEWKQKPS